MEHPYSLASSGYHAFKTDHNACYIRPTEPLAGHAKADLLMPTNGVTMVWTSD